MRQHGFPRQEVSHSSAVLQTLQIRTMQRGMRKIRAYLLETVKDGWQEEVIRGHCPRQFSRDAPQKYPDHCQLSEPSGEISVRQCALLTLTYSFSDGELFTGGIHPSLCMNSLISLTPVIWSHIGP